MLLSYVLLVIAVIGIVMAGRSTASYTLCYNGCCVYTQPPSLSVVLLLLSLAPSPRKISTHAQNRPVTMATDSNT